MQKLKAAFLLLLFCGYTVGSFATVHHCGSKITDIDILSIADCEHEIEEVSSSCNDHCCHEEESKEDAEKDCCKTTKLSSCSEVLVYQSSESSDKLDLIQFKITNEYFYSLSCNSPPSVGQYKSLCLTRDIPLEIQCFRI